MLFIPYEEWIYDALEAELIWWIIALVFCIFDVYMWINNTFYDDLILIKTASFMAGIWFAIALRCIYKYFSVLLKGELYE